MIRPPLLRRVVVATATGALTVTAAWAGTGLAPVPTSPPVDDAAEAAAGAAGAALAPGSATATDAAAASTTTAATADHTQLPDGWVLAGAAKVSLEPDPEAYGGTWVRDRAACATLSEAFVTELPDSATHVAAAGSPWPENPDCIYMGGYGIGPMNPITEWDDVATPADDPLAADPAKRKDGNGLWVRSAAIRDRHGDTLVLTIIDAEGYFWDYERKCEAIGVGCGAKQIAERLGAELGIAPGAFVIGATHSHTAMDYIGGWGFVPDWYMRQTVDAIETSIREAVAGMQPARLEVGEETARQHNRERRDGYRSAEEQQLTWLRAYVPETTTTTTTGKGNSGGKGNGDGSNETTETTTTPARTIATIGAYAAHPTTRDEGDGIAHADWFGWFERTVEERFGGVGLMFPSGLGNMSAAGGTEMGKRLGALVPDVGGGRLLDDTDLRVAQRTWKQPVTNVPLSALGVPGFFDRRFLQEPATLETGKNGQCRSASPVSVEVAATGARIGDAFALTAGPGELFSNLTNTIKELSGAAVTMPIAQANDALGYLPQEFEHHEHGQQGAGFATSGPAYVEYEDAYAIDRCFGDMTLEVSKALLDALAAQ